LKKIKLVVTAIAAIAVLALPIAAEAKADKSNSRDRNHDGLPDKWEKRHHLSLKVNQAQRDQDKDGLTNIGEFRSGTNPRDADSDNNGVSDAAEDPDHDGVDNENEIHAHLNPRSADSNHNGVKDGQEDRDHDGLSNADEQRLGDDISNPDSNHDGVDDGSEVNGTVASFDSASGLLTIRLPDNSTVSGTVDSTTAIECKSKDEGEQANEDHHAGSHPKQGADDSPSGSTTSGSGGSTTCTTADLQPDTLVHEAELEGGSFRKVEILK
jgi:hypothetical protein